MQISEVKIKLIGNRSDRLKAFCSITFDDEFVIRDLKIIEGAKGFFVAMPSRKLTDHCQACGAKNHLRAKFCNECGVHLNENRGGRVEGGRTKLHADIAHPINSPCREYLQEEIVKAYQEEQEKSQHPDYQPPDLDSYDDDYSTEHPKETTLTPPEPPAPTAPEPEPEPQSQQEPEPEPEKKPDNTSFTDGIF